MRKNSTNFFLMLILLTHLSWVRAENLAAPLSDNIFSSCDFTIEPTNNIDLSIGKKNHFDSDEFCALSLESTGKLNFERFGGSGLSLIIARRPTNIESFFSSDGGFSKTKKGYTFKGKPFTVIGISKFKNLRFTELHQGGDLILIGQQTEMGTVSQGPTGPFEVAYISRATPDFVVSVWIAYEGFVPKKVSDQITSDLVKIVTSVKPAAP